MLRLLRMAIASYEAYHVLQKPDGGQNTICRKISRGVGGIDHITFLTLHRSLVISFRFAICHGKSQYKRYFCKKSGES